MRQYSFLLGLFREDNKFLGKLVDFNAKLSVFNNIRAIDRTIEKTIAKATKELTKILEELNDKGEQIYLSSVSVDEIDKADEIKESGAICIVPIYITLPDKTERINITLPGKTLSEIKYFCKKNKIAVSNFFTEAAVELMKKRKRESANENKQDYVPRQ